MFNINLVRMDFGPALFIGKVNINHHYFRFPGCTYRWSPQTYATGYKKMCISDFSVAPAKLVHLSRNKINRK